MIRQNVILKLALKLFQERSLKIPRDECWPLSRIIIGKVNDIFSGKCFLHSVYFIYQKYGWIRENEMFNLNLYFKDNAHLIGQGTAKL